MNQLFHKLRNSTLTALVLLAAFSGNSQAETVWSNGGTYSEGGTITDGLTITASDAVNITGKYTVSGVLDGSDLASIRLFGAGTVTVKNGGELTIQAETGTQSGLTAYPGANLTVESGATMNITTNGERVRFSRGNTTLNDKNTTVNWAGNGTWDLGGNYFFSLTSAGNSNKSTFNITGGSLNIKNAKMYMAFSTENYWNITGGTLTVGEGNHEVVFGGGDWNASATTTGKITVNGGTFNVRGSGEWTWGKQNSSTPSNLTLDLKIQSGKFSTSRSITQNTNIATRNETITLAGGTFEAVTPDGSTTATSLSVAGGIATSLTASSTFSVAEGVTLTYNSPITRTAGDLTKTGKGTLKLTSATNSLSGGKLLISEGTVSVSSANQLGNATINMGNGTLQATESFTLSNQIFLVKVDGTNYGTAGFDVASGKTLTLSTGTDYDKGSLRKTGAGTLYIGSNNGNTGMIPLKLYLDEGTLAVEREATMDGNKTITMKSGTTFDFCGKDSSTTGAKFVVDAGTKDAPVSVTLNVTKGKAWNTSGTWNMGGSLTIPAYSTVEKTGNGTLKLTSNASSTIQSGSTLKLTAGTVQISNANQVGSATLALNGGTLSTTAAMTLSNAITLSTHSTINAAADLTLTGKITGPSTDQIIYKNGSGTLTLSNASSSMNNVIIYVNAGNMKITESLTLKSISANASGPQLEIAAGKTVKLTNGLENWNGTKFHKTGAGTLIIANDEWGGAFSTNFYLDGGTLVLNRGATMTDAKTLYLANGTTFRFQGTNATSSTVSTTGTATLDLPSGKTMSHSGTFVGGTLNKTGAGKLKLTGKSASTTSFNVQAGTIELATQDGATAATDLSLAEGTELLVSAPNQNVAGTLTLTNQVIDLSVNSRTDFTSLAAKTINVSDATKFEIAFNDEMDPFSLGTLELLTANEFQKDGTTMTQEQALDFMANNVEFSSAWAQMTVVPTSTGAYALAVQTDFNKIPEPATWVLLLLGVGIGGLKFKHF